jgi:hypothetical protein
MKIVVVGDLHGKECWKKIDASRYDKVIFLGDYVDDNSVEDERMVKNLEDIVRFHSMFPNKVVLLLGNHDMHYAEFPSYRCSLFRETIQKELTQIFQDNWGKFQVAFQFNNHLFTHAGVTNKFFSEVLSNSPISISPLSSKDLNIAGLLNELHNSSEQWKLNIVGLSRGGTSSFSGITWADIAESSMDSLSGYHQVVGHSRVPDFLLVPGADLDTSITYIDVLDSVTKFYELYI